MNYGWSRTLADILDSHPGISYGSMTEHRYFLTRTTGHVVPYGKRWYERKGSKADGVGHTFAYNTSDIDNMSLSWSFWSFLQARTRKQYFHVFS